MPDDGEVPARGQGIRKRKSVLGEVVKQRARPRHIEHGRRVATHLRRSKLEAGRGKRGPNTVERRGNVGKSMKSEDERGVRLALATDLEASPSSVDDLSSKGHATILLDMSQA